MEEEQQIWEKPTKSAQFDIMESRLWVIISAEGQPQIFEGTIGSAKMEAKKQNWDGRLFALISEEIDD